MEMRPASCSAHDEARCCGAGAGLRVLDLDTPWKGVEAVSEGQMNGMSPTVSVSSSITDGPTRS